MIGGVTRLLGSGSWNIARGYKIGELFRRYPLPNVDNQLQAENNFDEGAEKMTVAARHKLRLTTLTSPN